MDAPTHMVTFEVEGNNGDIAATVDGEAINSGDEVLETSEVVFTATPDQGYKVLEWTLNGDVVEGHTDEEFIIESLGEAVHVTVEFEALDEFEVTFFVIDGNGDLIAEVDGVEITSGDLVLEGETVLFTATPDEGYELDIWAVNGVEYPDITSLVVQYADLDMDIEVTVKFQLIPTPEYIVTFGVEDGEGSIIAEVDGVEISSGDSVEEGKDVVFTATPDDEYVIVAWYIDGVVIDDFTDNVYTYTSLDGDIDIKVEFEYSNIVDGIDVANITVYPNPARTNARIVSDVTINEIIVVGVLGEVVFEQVVGDTHYDLNVSNFRSGIYFVRLVTENGIVTKRLQVN